MSNNKSESKRRIITVKNQRQITKVNRNAEL